MYVIVYVQLLNMSHYNCMFDMNKNKTDNSNCKFSTSFQSHHQTEWNIASPKAKDYLRVCLAILTWRKFKLLYLQNRQALTQLEASGYVEGASHSLSFLKTKLFILYRNAIWTYNISQSSNNMVVHERG